MTISQSVENPVISCIPRPHRKINKNNKYKRINKYIYDTFQCFCQNKQQITLDLEELTEANKDMVDLIMYGVEEEKERTDDDADVCFTYHENWEQLQCCCGDMIEGLHECETTIKKVSIRECSRSDCKICEFKYDKEFWYENHWSEEGT